MKIFYSKKFKKNFDKRIPINSPLDKKYQTRLRLFINNPNDSLIKNHKLTGRLQGYSAFSITGDILVIFVQESKDTVLFLDVGTHNQVYS